MVSQKPHRHDDKQGAGSGEHGEHRLREVGQEVAEQARNKAREAGTRVKRSGRSVLHTQKERAISELGTISDAIWQAADKLREEDDHNIAEVVEGVASRLDNVSDYLREHHLEDVMQEINDFGRRRPEVLLGGMFCIGLAIGRLLKASGTPRSALEDTSEEDYGDHGGSPYFGNRPEYASASPSSGSPMARAADVAPPSTTPTGGPSHRTTSPGTGSTAGAKVEAEGTSTPGSSGPGSSGPGSPGSGSTGTGTPTSAGKTSQSSSGPSTGAQGGLKGGLDTEPDRKDQE